MLQRKRELELRNNQRLAKTKSLQSSHPPQQPLTASTPSPPPPVAVVLPPEQPLEVPATAPPTGTPTTATLSAGPNNARRISIGVYGGSRSAVSSEPQHTEGVSRASIGLAIDPLQTINASPSRSNAGAGPTDPTTPSDNNPPNPNCTSPRTWATFTKSQRK
eukprot:TRINITY_DN5784_c0_g1_i2.p2 TRINITY_DN5784_c0_g1~~TRINITY_DN5784_c0_g1_i2.p2  ORF type:complete len:162 (+),score=50.47 TRINITY_DN5784_c0_g1_i2:77-562(+)